MEQTGAVLGATDTSSASAKLYECLDWCPSVPHRCAASCPDARDQESEGEELTVSCLRLFHDDRLMELGMWVLDPGGRPERLKQ